MRQAITTKYLGPTNTKCARVKATCQGATKTLNWDHELDPGANHEKAAKALAHDLNWDVNCELVAGAAVEGYVFVLVLKGRLK